MHDLGVCHKPWRFSLYLQERSRSSSVRRSFLASKHPKLPGMVHSDEICLQDAQRLEISILRQNNAKPTVIQAQQRFASCSVRRTQSGLAVVPTSFGVWTSRGKVDPSPFDNIHPPHARVYPSNLQWICLSPSYRCKMSQVTVLLPGREEIALTEATAPLQAQAIEHLEGNLPPQRVTNLYIRYYHFPAIQFFFIITANQKDNSSSPALPVT